MKARHWTIGLAACLWPGLVAAGAPTQVQAADAAHRVASELNQAAHRLLRQMPLTPQAIDASLVLVRESAALRPDDADQWRRVRKVATLAERDDVVDEALGRILALDPGDEAARLLRLLVAVERYQTMEQRVAALEQLLSAENRGRLRPAVASRLAMNLAFLHQRGGNLDAFAHWLAEASIIDPANREAAAVAAGFFSANRDDAYAEAELLANLIVADQTDLGAQIELARLLLDAGAYPAAERTYELLLSGLIAEEVAADDNIIADLATVKWALGKPDEALQLIDRRRRDQANQAQRSAAPGTAAAPPTDTVLATVAAAIRGRQPEGGAESAMEIVRSAYAARLGELAGLADTAAAQAQLHLQLAWITMWLARDAEAARASLGRADELVPVSDQAKARFEGLAAWCAGDAARAIELLQPLVDSDPASRLGMALACRDLNRARDAARHLLAVARAQPGTLMGVWSADMLAEMVGQRVPLTDQARRLNELIESLPRGLERQARQGTTGLTFRIRPGQSTYSPFDPLPITISISNQAVSPLAVDHEGPIRPQIVVFCDVRGTRLLDRPPPPAFIIDIDRTLRLEPGETYTITFDLRDGVVADALDELAVWGANVTVTGMINFHARADGVLHPGLLGSAASTPLIRVDGVRMTEQWVVDTIAAVQAGDDPLPRDVALLSHLAAEAPGRDGAEPTAQHIDEARAAVLSAFPRLAPLDQAWILSVLPAHDAFEPLLNVARRSDDRHVQMAYLLSCSSGPDDPMIDAAMRGDDEDIRIVAEAIRAGGDGDEGP